MKLFKIITLGCKVNVYEAQSIAEDLVSVGYQQTDGIADIYVLLTCAVTNVAESKTRKKINQLKRENPEAILCVVGCYVQINAIEMAKDKAISILVGSSSKAKISQFIKQYEQDLRPIYALEDISKFTDFEGLKINKFQKQTRAYLKIQDGCNQFCSYCIIPYARGNERSIELDEAILSAKQLVSSGHREIVLAGIHTGRYADQSGHRLIDLLKALTTIEGLQRIRLSSIEITEITDDMIAFMQSNTKLARHLHIPLQSGCDPVLKAMNRPYTTALFLSRVQAIKAALPSISISTDLIVGYPNETEKMFEETYNFLKEVNFSFIHVFPFSKKANTKAAELVSVVSDIERKKRTKICTDLSNELYYNYQLQFIGKTLDVLVEKGDFGHSSEYIPVYLNHKCQDNQMIQSTILSIEKNHLMGE